MPGEVPAKPRRSRGVDEAELHELMVGYQRGDAASADRLARLVAPLLLGYLSGWNLGRGEAEDLVQECWLRIHRSRHTYRPSEPVLPWMFAIARHTGLDGYRRRRRVESREIAVERLPERPSKAEPPAGEFQEEITRALEQLPQSQRDVIWMLKVSGMSLEEVARATSCSVGSVKQKAHRAYSRLRRLLGEERQT